MCLINLAEVWFELGCEQFEREREESEHHNGGSEGEWDDDITEILGMSSDDSTSPNEKGDNVGGPEEQKG